MNILCVLAQKNEAACLDPWVRYHAYMVGMENLHIIDNASDDPIVIEKLKFYEQAGIGITRIPPGTDFGLRGNYTSELINEIESTRNFDFVFPMDCDEFLAVFTADGRPSCRREDVHNYLARLKSREGIYEMPGCFENINSVPGVFRWRSDGQYTKVYFSGRQCVGLDIGYHNGVARNGLPRIKGDIFYVHYQVKPYSMFRKLGRQKLEPFVNPDDREALQHLKDSRGINFHVASMYLLTEEEYNNTLQWQRVKENERMFVEFNNLLKVLGLNPNIFDG